MAKIVAFSDSHCQHYRLDIPACDLLICAGDVSNRGREDEVRSFARWFSQQPAKHLVWVPGNHELLFERHLPLSKIWFQEDCPKAKILINDYTEIDDIKIYGSPSTPYFYNWAWNYEEYELEELWRRIPLETDILITHGPPATILDKTIAGYLAGSPSLYKKVFEIKPKHHIFGHIHEGAGSLELDGIQFHNVSVLDERYELKHEPKVIIFPSQGK